MALTKEEFNKYPCGDAFEYFLLELREDVKASPDFAEILPGVAAYAEARITKELEALKCAAVKS